MPSELPGAAIGEQPRLLQFDLGDPQVLEVGAGTEARRHEDLGRAERAGGHHDLAAGPHRADTSALDVVHHRGAPSVEAEPGDVDPGPDLEVGSVQVGVDERGGHAVALPVLLGDLHVVAAVVLGAVVAARRRPRT